MLGIFCLLSYQVFGENKSTSSQVNSENKQFTLTSIGAWFNNFLSKETFTPNIFVNINDIETVPTKNDILITWTVDTLVTARVYYDIKSPVLVASTTPWVDASAYGSYANSKATIRRLTPGVTYYFKIVIQESSGDVSISKEISCMTRS